MQYLCHAGMKVQGSRCKVQKREVGRIMAFGPLTFSLDPCTFVLSESTRLTVDASSREVIGFERKVSTPRPAAVSRTASSASPVQRMTGISGRTRRSSSARPVPVMEGIVQSVITRSNPRGLSLNFSRASLLDVLSQRSVLPGRPQGFSHLGPLRPDLPFCSSLPSNASTGLG